MPSFPSLTVFNGSPRGRAGNTGLLAGALCDGYEAAGGGVAGPAILLRDEGSHPDAARAFSEAERILLAFPLYADAMPGVVKAFIEALEPLCSREANAPIAFLVHSGFPEGTHARRIERYLGRLAARLRQPCLGTIVKGNSEGMRHRTADENAAVFAKLKMLGADLASGRPMSPDALAALASPERFPWWMVPIGHVMARLPAMSTYWDGMLKANGAYERRFARPYAD